MHEFSIAESIISIVQDETREYPGRQIRSIKLRVGILKQIVPEILDTAMELLTEGTNIHGTSIELETEGVEVSCLDCELREIVYELPFACSACDSPRIRCKGGEEISLLSIELDEVNENGDSGTP